MANVRHPEDITEAIGDAVNLRREFVAKGDLVGVERCEGIVTRNITDLCTKDKVSAGNNTWTCETYSPHCAVLVRHTLSVELIKYALDIGVERFLAEFDAGRAAYESALKRLGVGEIDEVGLRAAFNSCSETYRRVIDLYRLGKIASKDVACGCY